MRPLPTLILLTIALTASAEGFAARKEAAGIPAATPPALSTMQSDGPDLGQAVEQVKRQCDGRIVDARTVQSGKRETHIIKCLTQDGKVRTFRIPGKRSG